MDPDPGALSSPRADLLSLAEGRWSAWSGLDPLPTVADVAKQLGEPLEPQPHGGVLGGSPTEFRRYRPVADEPMIIVWYEGDVAVAVQIEHPIRSVIDDELGPPDDVLDSAVGEDWEQHLHGAAGLVLHVRRPDPSGHPDAALLFGLPPFTADEFRHDPLRFEGGRRRRSW